MESNWLEGPTEHQAQSFTKLDMPSVVRAGQARQWERGWRNTGGQTVGHTHLGGWRMGLGCRGNWVSSRVPVIRVASG